MATGASERTVVEYGTGQQAREGKAGYAPQRSRKSMFQHVCQQVTSSPNQGSQARFGFQPRRVADRP